MKQGFTASSGFGCVRGTHTGHQRSLYLYCQRFFFKKQKQSPSSICLANIYLKLYKKKADTAGLRAMYITHLTHRQQRKLLQSMSSRKTKFESEHLMLNTRVKQINSSPGNVTQVV